MLSCSPAQAARRSDSGPGASRWSSAPACRRIARICARLSSMLVRAPAALATVHHQTTHHGSLSVSSAALRQLQDNSKKREALGVAGLIWGAKRWEWAG
jgi:hypothetical protein